MSRIARLAYFVSHPIQYQAPLLRRIAREPEIDLKVFFSSDRTAREFVDEGFGVQVKWDVPLLEGYAHEFLPCLKGRKADRPGFARPFNLRVFESIANGGFDAVWVHGYHTATALRAIFSASMLDVPVLLRAESTLDDRERSAVKLAVKRAFFSVLRRHVRGALAIGQANAAYWRHYLGQDVPIHSMPYAVDNDFFKRQARLAEPAVFTLRRDLGLAAGRPVVLFAAKLQTRKRCADLLAAWRELRDWAARPYLLIVGDGEERAALEAQAAGWPDVRFLGFRNQTEMPLYFAMCDVFVLPSEQEPWGLVVNEVMNAARAVIVSDQVGCRADLVEDGVNGRVFPARDVAALADALRDVLGTPGRAQTMGLAGLEKVRRHGFEQDVAGLRRALADCVPGFEVGTGP